MRDISPFLEQVRQWAVSNAHIVAVVLVGSFARNAARDDSDIDLMIITDTPTQYLANLEWVALFGHPAQIAHEDWGMVQSVRVFYTDGPETEFGITTPTWAATQPVDPGTERVIRDGARLVYDPQGIAAALVEAVHSQS